MHLDPIGGLYQRTKIKPKKNKNRESKNRERRIKGKIERAATTDRFCASVLFMKSTNRSTRNSASLPGTCSPTAAQFCVHNASPMYVSLDQGRHLLVDQRCPPPSPRTTATTTIATVADTAAATIAPTAVTATTTPTQRCHSRYQSATS
jgi:hypothetical protein